MSQLFHLPYSWLEYFTMEYIFLIGLFCSLSLEEFTQWQEGARLLEQLLENNSQPHQEALWPRCAAASAAPLTAAGLANEECAYSLKKGRGSKVITLLNCNWKYSFKFSTSLWVKVYGLRRLWSVWRPKVTSLRKIDTRLVFELSACIYGDLSPLVSGFHWCSTLTPQSRFHRPVQQPGGKRTPPWAAATTLDTDTQCLQYVFLTSPICSQIHTIPVGRTPVQKPGGSSEQHVAAPSPAGAGAGRSEVPPACSEPDHTASTKTPSEDQVTVYLSSISLSGPHCKHTLHSSITWQQASTRYGDLLSLLSLFPHTLLPTLRLRTYTSSPGP